MPKEYTLQQIAERINAQVNGDPECVITSLGTLQSAESGELAFLANKTYRKFLATTGASAVILHPSLMSEYQGNALVMDNPYLGYALASVLFDDSPPNAIGVHPSACVAETAVLQSDVSVGPNVVIGEHVEIGKNTVIGAGCSINDNSSIGENGWVAANVSIYHNVVIGDNVRIHSNAVIGSDGFGFAPQKDGSWQKICQLGGVVIGNNVEIGACTTIDRGALGDTVIEDGVIMDNHVLIAHNVRVGENTAFAGCAAVAGSTVIGRNCIFAGRAGAVGHITIGDGVQIGLATTATKSISEPGVYCAGTPVTKASDWRKNAARFNQLDELNSRVKELEKPNK